MNKIKLRYKNFGLSLVVITSVLLSGCTDEFASTAKVDSTTKEVTSAAEVKQGTMKLDQVNGRIGSKVKIEAEGLIPNQPLDLIWSDMIGSYDIDKNNYSYIGTKYEPVEKKIASGQADASGKWNGEFVVPEGFGDDHDVMIQQDGKKVAQANYFVETFFSISPTSGPIGTEITIHGEGLSAKMYGSLWHLNYDNTYTGMITGVSTNGRATGKMRATGKVGEHTMTIEGGSSGLPYLNRAQSAINYIHTQYFTFNVTDSNPVGGSGSLTYVEAPPKAASGGIKLPDPVNKSGVTITLDKSEGIVGEQIVMKGTGLPKNEKVTFNWHTMVGNRVTKAGFGEKIFPLGTGEMTTNDQGEFVYNFAVPDDLGGLPHLIEIKAKEETYGQTYLKILPSIVDISPKSGPAGTPFTITIKGSGWTEYDNTYNVVYNNANIGYICGFNSQGNIKLPLIATGDPGYQLIDIYPGIYKGQEIQPNLYLRPQLTYLDDHPGTAIPTLRTYFEITK